MGTSTRLLAVSSSLLFLIAKLTQPVCSQDLRWPYNLPIDSKYFPEDEFLIRRNVDVQQKLQTQTAAGVRKMSGDPGEKFYLHYWSFEGEDRNEDSRLWSNQSLSLPFENSYSIHGQSSNIFPRFLGFRGLSLLEKRDFTCPSGTNACTSINRPNSCCESGLTCQIIQDTGLGDVGCCPAGQYCAGSLSTCLSGYSSCPNSPGGGCCLPGYACYEVGCVQTATATLVVTPSTIRSTRTETLTVIVTPTIPTLATSTITITTIHTNTPTILPPAPSPSTSTVTIRPETTSTSTSISVVPVPLPPPATLIVTSTIRTTLTSSGSILTVTSITRTTITSSTALPCASGFRSCPASLGGGCCNTDRECGSVNCPASTSSGTLIPPARPTTEVTTSIISTRTGSLSGTGLVGCPTGFYACSAYYQGGCCQIGRDCGMTSCPTSASTTLVSGNSITAVAPTGSGITAPDRILTGSCAQGWSTCGQNVGGGCCPSGFACGTSCTATASGGNGLQVGKIAPNGASIAVMLNLCYLFSVCFLSMVLVGMS